MKPLQWGPLVLSLLVAPLGAQTAASGSLGTSAAIVAPVAVTANAPLDFGKLTGSQTVTIATDDATSGRFTVTTDPNINVTVSVTPPAALSDGASHTLPVSGTSITFTGGSDHAGGTSVSYVSASFSGLATIYFRLGATVVAGAAQAGGLYTGVFVITAHY